MLEKPANIIVNQCLNIKNYEKVLIITDKNKLKIANSILHEAKKITITNKPIIRINIELFFSNICDYTILPFSIYKHTG